MGSSISRAQTSDPVRSLEEIRPKPAKAGLTSDHIGLTFSAVMRDAILGHYGSVKAAALSLDVDPSLMQREFNEGKFGRLEKADEIAKASIFAAVHNVYGPLASPRARGHFLLDRIMGDVSELRQLVEHIA